MLSWQPLLDLAWMDHWGVCVCVRVCTYVCANMYVYVCVLCVHSRLSEDHFGLTVIDECAQVCSNSRAGIVGLE